MKRIDAIVKGTGSLVSSLINRKASRVMRAVEQAIAFAEDKADYYNDAAEEQMNSFGNYAGAEQSEYLSESINAYLSKVKSGKEWSDAIVILKELKAKLNAEVKVDKPSDKAKKNEE